MKQDISKPIALSVKKLAKDFSFLHCEIWGGLEDFITLDDVHDKLTWNKKDLPSKPRYFSTGEDVTEFELREYHSARIAYLVRYPTNDPISIFIGGPTFCNLSDGNHRLSAAIVRGDESILVELDGDEAKIKKFIKKYKPNSSKL